MSVLFKPVVRALTAVALLLTLFQPARAAQRAELPTWPYDVSPAGLRAAASQMSPSERAKIFPMLPEATLQEVQRFIGETRVLGISGRSGRIPVITSGPPNVRANNPAGDRTGETQSEVSIAVYRDTVVIGWNDSQGFLGAPITLSSFAYSTNGGATFTDGGNVPLALPTDQAFGDTGLDTDERGNWYLNSIYTRAAGAPGATAQQNIGVHHGRFNGGGVLVWDPPTMASIGTTATGNLDKCLLAVDRVTGNVYTSYTRFLANGNIEIVRSTTLGLTWDPPVIIDNQTTVPTASKQSARPFCGPSGEVYVVWEKGANTINCPDGSGNVSNTTGVIAFTRSLDFGLTYSPFTTIGNVDHSWTWSGPGDLRERANDFPDIAVDRSGGSKNGNLYVTWHESAPWTANTLPGPVKVETGVINNNPGTPDLFVIGDDATGAITPAGDLDYWQFSAVQGQNLLIDVIPQGWNCGVTGTARGMRMRMFATQTPYPNPTGFPDSLLAAVFLGAFEPRIVWTAPKTGSYLIRLQISSGTTTGTYTLRVRPLTFGAPSAGRDARDVVAIRSTDQGSTWSAEQRINDSPAGLEERRPFNAVDGQGHVHVFWHDSRVAGLGSNAALAGIWGTTSRDGGLTWSPNYEVSDELSFFSFNTLAVPNLGDYNQAASWGAVTHPAWSDQRISTGDVRTPGTNVFTAGRGPDAYTTTVAFAFSIACPLDTVVGAKSIVSRLFTITNTGNVPDNYVYSVTDNAGWIGAPVNGTTGPVAPGASVTVKVTATGDADCNPPTDVVTFAVTPVGDQSGPTTCTTTLTCTPVSISKILVSDHNPSDCGDKVNFTATLTQSDATGQVDFFDGAILIGSAPVINGSATLSIATLLAGSHSITANYLGDGGHLAVTSNKVDQVVNRLPTSTLLVSDMNPSECGGKVNFTATVSPAVATGTVSFYDGLNLIETASLTGGSATISFSDLTAGSHSITVVYSGDACYTTSNSNKIDQVVNPIATTTSLDSEPNPSGCGQDANFVATVSPSPGGGTVNFFDGATHIGSAAVLGATATLTLATLSVGSHSITAVFKGTDCYLSSTSNKLVHEVVLNVLAVALSADVNPATCGAKVTFKARLIEPLPPGLAFNSGGHAIQTPAPPTGTVNFFDGGNPIGSAPVVDSVATLSVPAFTVGSHSITATYKGDACYALNTSEKLNLTVDPNPTTTTLSSSPNPSNCDEKVTVTAKVDPTPAGGMVTLYDGSVTVGTAPVVNGFAVFSVVLSGGTHSLTAEYSGDGCFGSSLADKIFHPVSLVTTTTTLDTAPNPSTCGDKVTLTARVDPAAATGEVNFYDNNGSSPIGSGTLQNGVVTLSVTTFTVGTHSLIAVYKGDGCHRASQSNKVEQVVQPIATATTITTDPNPSTCGAKVTITAKVVPASATGEVNFFDGTTQIGAVTLVNGAATLSITTLGVGPHSLTAVYKGDACHAPSTSNKVDQAVLPAPTTTTLTSSPNPSTCQQKATLTATVAPANATGEVNFFDGGLPIGSGTLVNGVATLSLTALSEGTHLFTAVYKGDGCNAGSTSNEVTHSHGCPTATLLSLFRAESVSGTVELRWQFGDPAGFSRSWIERGVSAQGPWTAIDAQTRVEAGVTVAVDRAVEPGKSYWYRLVAQPDAGAALVFGPLSATAGGGIQRFELASIWPNPSKGNFRVDFAVAREANIRLSIVDIQGREVAVLAEGTHRPGRYQAVWTGETSHGPAAVGMYFVRYQVPNKVLTGRLVLAR